MHLRTDSWPLVWCSYYPQPIHNGWFVRTSFSFSLRTNCTWDCVFVRNLWTQLHHFLQNIHHSVFRSSRHRLFSDSTTDLTPRWSNLLHIFEQTNCRSLDAAILLLLRIILPLLYIIHLIAALFLSLFISLCSFYLQVFQYCYQLF